MSRETRATDEHEHPPEWFTFALVHVFVVAPIAYILSSPITGFLQWLTNQIWHPWPQVLSATLLSAVWCALSWKACTFEISLLRIGWRGIVSGVIVLVGTVVGMRVAFLTRSQDSYLWFYCGPAVPAIIGIAIVMLVWRERKTAANAARGTSVAPDK